MRSRKWKCVEWWYLISTMDDMITTASQHPKPFRNNYFRKMQQECVRTITSDRFWNWTYCNSNWSGVKMLWEQNKWKKLKNLIRTEEQSMRNTRACGPESLPAEEQGRTVNVIWNTQPIWIWFSINLSSWTFISQISEDGKKETKTRLDFDRAQVYTISQLPTFCRNIILDNCFVKL